MAKEISGFIKLQIKGGQANPAPPVGPALGSFSAISYYFRIFMRVSAPLMPNDASTPVYRRY